MWRMSAESVSWPAPIRATRGARTWSGLPRGSSPHHLAVSRRRRERSADRRRPGRPRRASASPMTDRGTAPWSAATRLARRRSGHACRRSAGATTVGAALARTRSAGEDPRRQRPPGRRLPGRAGPRPAGQTRPPRTVRPRSVRAAGRRCGRDGRPRDRHRAPHDTHPAGSVSLGTLARSRACSTGSTTTAEPYATISASPCPISAESNRIATTPWALSAQRPMRDGDLGLQQGASVTAQTLRNATSTSPS